MFRISCSEAVLNEVFAHLILKECHTFSDFSLKSDNLEAVKAGFMPCREQELSHVIVIYLENR